MRHRICFNRVILIYPKDVSPTAIGWEVTLEKVGVEEVYSTPIDTVKVVIEMQTNQRIHIKVGKMSLYNDFDLFGE